MIQNLLKSDAQMATIRNRLEVKVTLQVFIIKWQNISI